MRCIREHRETQQRLRDLASRLDRLLPPEVAGNVKRLSEIGLSQRWIDPFLPQIFEDYDHAHDLDPDDPAWRLSRRRPALGAWLRNTEPA